MWYYIITIIVVLLLRIILPNKGKMAEKMVHHKLMDLNDNYHIIDDAIVQYQQVVISEELKQRIITRINEHLTFGKEAVKEHKQLVHQRQYQQEAKIEHGICSRCGGRLVLRNSKFGQFYGCSNYPRCKFTMSLFALL